MRGCAIISAPEGLQLCRRLACGWTLTEQPGRIVDLCPITLPVALSMIGPAESMIERRSPPSARACQALWPRDRRHGSCAAHSLGSAIHLPLTSCFHSTFPTASLSIWFFSLSRICHVLTAHRRLRA